LSFELKNRIIYLRKEHDFSQQALADFSGLSRSVVAKLETGEKQIDDEIAPLLAAAFKVSAVYFEELSYSKKAGTLLEKIFDALLIGEMEQARHLIDKVKHRLSLEQERCLKYLEASYYFKMGEIQLANGLMDNYFSLFSTKEATPDCQRDSIKYQLLFEYETNFQNRKLVNCRDICLNLLKHLTVSYQKGSVYILMARVAFLAGNYPKANLKISKAKNFLEDNPPTKLFAQYQITFAAILGGLKLFEEAKKVQNDLLEFAEEHELPGFAAMVYQHRGYQKTLDLNYKEAIHDFKIAYARIETKTKKIQILFSLIHAHVKLHEFATAIGYIAEARMLDMGVYQEMILSSYEAELLLYQRNFRRHKTLLKKVLKYFEENNLTKDLRYVYSYLADYYADKNPKEAVQYYTLRERLKREEN